MGVFTSKGGVNKIVVNHSGVVKEVVSGWVDQNGVAVPFYKKGGGLPFTEQNFTASNVSVSSSGSRLVVELDATNVKTITLTGTFSAHHYANYTGTTYMNLMLTPVSNTYIAQVACSGTTTRQVNLGIQNFDVSDVIGYVRIYFSNGNQTKRLTYNLTVKLE
jgi:hypothetical protein